MPAEVWVTLPSVPVVPDEVPLTAPLHDPDTAAEPTGTPSTSTTVTAAVALVVLPVLIPITIDASCISPPGGMRLFRATILNPARPPALQVGSISAKALAPYEGPISSWTVAQPQIKKSTKVSPGLLPGMVVSLY